VLLQDSANPYLNQSAKLHHLEDLYLYLHHLEERLGI
jgi:hypothetical protein